MAKKKTAIPSDAVCVKGDELELDIVDIGTDGEGIGRVDGYTLFVKDAVAGDRVRVRVMKTKKHYGYARLLEILRPSEDRVTPQCPVARSCGGCQIQHCDYQAQLAWKQKKVEDCLTRIGGLSVSMEPIMGMDEPWHYRNKAQYPVGYDREGHLVSGFYAGRTHDIIPCTDCEIAHPCAGPILETVLRVMEEYGIPAYDEKTHTGLVRHVLTRVGFVSHEVMVCLVINGGKIPYEDKLIEALLACPLPAAPEQEPAYRIASISVNINKEKTNRILGDKVRTIYGTDTITDDIGGIHYQISPLSFYQVNPLQTRRLYETALEFAKLQGNETVWDLYCGIGTISLFLAQKAAQVYGVEIVPQAIEDARKNARLNGITNAEFFVGAAEQVVPEKYAQSGGTMRADVVSLDPPRKGCDEKLLQTVVAMAPEKIVYVSCDPATLARDLKYLCAEGYEVRRVRACDMFPHTSHVETVCLLSKLHEAKHHVNVRLDMDEMDLTSAESKATYEEIKAYVAEHNDGMQVSNLYIAQVKAKYGIKERANYNLPKLEDVKQPHCPKEKEDAIVEALRFFHMI